MSPKFDFLISRHSFDPKYTFGNNISIDIVVYDSKNLRTAVKILNVHPYGWYILFGNLMVN